MGAEPKRFKNDEPFRCLPNDLPPGCFIQYDAPIPAYVPHPHAVRGEHARVLVLAAHWKQGEIGGIPPRGTVYLIHTYRDDEHGKHGKHFNANSFFLFMDCDGQAWLLRLKDDEDLVSAIALGTSLPQLKHAFELPERELGRIHNLLSKNTTS